MRAVRLIAALTAVTGAGLSATAFGFPHPIADTRPHVVKGHHYAWTVPTLMRPSAIFNQRIR